MTGNKTGYAPWPGKWHTQFYQTRARGGADGAIILADYTHGANKEDKKRVVEIHRTNGACLDNPEAVKKIAHLIAAAPELYEALEAAEEWLEGWASAEHELKTIRTALSKARGETNG